MYTLFTLRRRTENERKLAVHQWGDVTKAGTGTGIVLAAAGGRDEGTHDLAKLVMNKLSRSVNGTSNLCLRGISILPQALVVPQVFFLRTASMYFSTIFISLLVSTGHWDFENQPCTCGV